MIKSKKTRKGDYVIVVICIFITLICLLPLINIAARSLSSAEALIRNEVFLIPKGLNFKVIQSILILCYGQHF